MPKGLWKVGELANKTGLSVRTLRYYDHIELLSPSRHTDAGHRLYGAGDVSRLYRIIALRNLGLSLDEIKSCLGRRSYSPQKVVQLQIDRLRKRMELEQRLCRRLEAIAGRLNLRKRVSVEQFIQTIREVQMSEKFEKYYTPEQREELARRKIAVGEDRIRQVEQEWADLFNRFRTEMDNGTDVASETVQELVTRYNGLINEFTGGNKEIEGSMAMMYRAEPNLLQQFGMNFDQPLREYIGKAMGRGRGSSQ